MFQNALGRILEIEKETWDKPESFIKSQASSLQPKRDFIVKNLQRTGLSPVEPQGGYFAIVDFTHKGRSAATCSLEHDFRKEKI